jgi:hypothetical protein
MISVIRTKFGPVLIGVIIGGIALVFVFYGFFTPGSGSIGGTTAGEVNGEPISYPEFTRALNQRVEFMKNLMGGKVSDEQLAQFHVREAVFQDLAQRKLMGQIAKKEGFYPSSDQIRDQILKMEVFQKDGHFDKVQYKAVLTQNQYNPTRFEEMIGQDIMEENFRKFLGTLANVTPDQVDADLKSAKEKRKIKYVFLDNESARKLLPANLKPEEQSKKLDEEVNKIASPLLAALSSNEDSKANALLKGTNGKVKSSDWLDSKAESITGVGSIRSIHPELFAMKKGDPAKRFTLMGGTLFAVLEGEEGYDASKTTPKERADVASRLQGQKQSEVMSDFMKSWMKKASITRNDKVVVGGQAGAIPVSPDN